MEMISAAKGQKPRLIRRADAAAEARSLTAQLGAEDFISTGVGHHPQIEMPELLAPRLLSFISGLQDTTFIDRYSPSTTWNANRFRAFAFKRSNP